MTRHLCNTAGSLSFQPFFPPIPVDKAALDVAEAPPKSFRHEGVEDRVEDRVEVVENTLRVHFWLSVCVRGVQYF